MCVMFSRAPYRRQPFATARSLIGSHRGQVLWWQPSCIGIETRGEFIHATSNPRMRSNAMWAIRTNIGDQWCKALQYPWTARAWLQACEELQKERNNWGRYSWGGDRKSGNKRTATELEEMPKQLSKEQPAESLEEYSSRQCSACAGHSESASSKGIGDQHICLAGCVC
jgi:hypothetical protein